MRFIPFLLLFSVFGFSQKETTKKNIVLKLENYNPKPEKKDSIVSVFEPPSLTDKKEADYLKKFTFKKEEKAESFMGKQEEFYDLNQEHKDRLNKKPKEPMTGNTENQNLGEFKLNTKLIRIVCWDHGDADGDRVKITINDMVLEENLTLSNGGNSIVIHLANGYNRLSFLALNQGSSGPNTAAFRIYDDTNTMISNNQWDLNTGVQAVVTLNNEMLDEPLENEEKEEK